MLIALLMTPAPMPRADEADDELAFAAALIEMGFNDFAGKVVDQARERWPQRAVDAQLIRAELLMAERQFDEAEAIVRTISPTTEAGKAIRLALANYYYAANEVDRARSLYDDFFQQFTSPPTDEKVLRFYREAAMVLSQMLENAEQYEKAAQNLARVLTTDLDPEQRRTVQARQATLCLKAVEAAGGDKSRLLETARGLAQDIQFGGPYWVARSMVLLADAERVAGNPDGALALLEDNLAIIKQVDDSLKELGARDQSPKAGYHFLRGRIFETDALKAAEQAAGKGEPARAEARKGLGLPLNEYARILKYYGGSDLATPATLRMRTIEDTIIALGGTIKRLTQIASADPQNAGELFRQGDLHYARGEDGPAIAEYTRALNLFPETESAFRVLSNLGRAYARSGDPLMAKMVTGYVGERFAGRDEAGQTCLILATFFRKNDLPELADDAYQVFVDHFPEHEKAPLVMYSLAQAKKAKFPGEANRLYRRIVEDYPKSEFYLRALQALGWDLHAIAKYDQALPYFRQYVAAAPEGDGKANAMMLAADSLLRLQDYPEAFKQYREIVTALDSTSASNPYYAMTEDRPKLARLYEQAFFQQAYCLSRIGGEGDQVDRFRTAALQAYDAFVQRFPDSELVSKALAGTGAVLLQLDRLDQATETFERLATDYPDSPEGRNSLYTLVTAAVKVGKLDLARNAVNKMAENPTAYQADMFALVGQLMLDHGLYAEAINAYEILGATSADPDLQERARFGLGRSYQAQGDCARAIDNLQALLKLNDRTAYLFDAGMLLAQACRACGRHDEAIEALTEIFRLDKDAARVKRANFELAQIQEAQGRKDAAFASYLRLALNPDPTRAPDLEPLFKQCTYRCVTLGMELQAYETVILMADKFQQVWGVGDDLAPEVRRLRGEAAIEQSKLASAP